MNDEQPSSRELTSSSLACPPDARWPPRTQQLLGELRALCGNWLHEPLRRSLEHFDMHLHRQTEHTLSHFDQQHYLATRQQLLGKRQVFEQRFIASIDQAFDQLGLPTMKSTAVIPQMLSLLEPLEHELTAALDQLVARSEARSGPQLVELGYRLAVLIAKPPLESDALPIGPQAMARAFRDACHTLGLPSVHELLLLQSLESSLIQGLAPLHELANAHLRDAGILPRLRPFGLPRAATRRDRVKNEKRSSSATPATAMGGHESMAVPDNQLEGPAHPQVRGDGSLPSRGSVVTDEELQVALAALQGHLTQVDERTRIDLNQPQRLREELLIQLNVGRPAQATRASLSTRQDDTVELIVRLFGQIAQRLPQTNDALSLLCDLQLPMLRVALIDHGFFDQHEHPARKVLGKVAEIACDWLDDANGMIDRGLRAKLGQLVARAGREPPSTALYVSLQDDIAQYLAQLQHKTQLAERRQIDAMQGLERLEQARHRTAELLAKRFANTAPQCRPLDHAWSDVLALTLLRHGEQSQVFGTRLAVTDQLLGLLPAGDRHKLQHEVETGLQQIGLQNDEVIQLAQRMVDASRRDELPGKALNASDRAALSEQSLQTGGPSNDAVETTHASPAINAFNVAAVTPNPEVLRIHRHLRALPAGAWFEFVDPSGRRGPRHRLVWYSPLTGHSLFVTRSGQRAEELGELQLAHEIVCARVREITDHEDVLDRAWRTVTQELGRRPITFGGAP